MAGARNFQRGLCSYVWCLGCGDSHQDHPPLHAAEAPPVRGLGLQRGCPKGRTWRLSVQESAPEATSLLTTSCGSQRVLSIGSGCPRRAQFTGKDDQGHMPRAFEERDMTISIFEKFTLRPLLKDTQEKIRFSFYSSL